jgi:hypothetical protein
MKLNNVLLSTKQTGLEYYRHSYDDPRKVFPKRLVDKKEKENREHYENYENIKKILAEYRIPFQRIYMPYGAYEEFKDRDLIISIGGDGTVLNSAHYILDDTPILTINSEKDSTGALCQITAKMFEKTLNKILNDDYGVEKWTRVEGKLGHNVGLALNDIVFQKPNGAMVDYNLSLNGKSEEQRSTRIIVSTGAGSTGLYHNIEHQKGTFDPRSLELRFAPSEDLRGKQYKMNHGYLYSGDVLKITSLTDCDGYISFDGDSHKRLLSFPMGQKLYVKISDKPLNVIIPGE